MRAKADAIVVLAVVLCVLVLAGEALTYSSGVHEYGADSSWTDGRVEYEVESSGGDVYDAVLLDNGIRGSITDLAVYVDGTYAEYYGDASRISTVPYQSQDYFADQIAAFLEFRSFHAVTTLDDDALSGYIEGTMEDPRGKAVMVSSYALPVSVYDGTPECPLMEWIGNGGTLYWVGTEIGRFFKDADGLKAVEDNQELFFGTRCVNTDGPTVATDRIGGGLSEALCLKNSSVINAVNADAVDGAVGIGYSEGGYSSIAMSPYGDGEVTVFAGPFDINQFDDIGQVVASGVNHGTILIAHERGDVVRGTVSGSISFDSLADPTLYIFIGGTYAKFAEAFHV